MLADRHLLGVRSVRRLVTGKTWRVGPPVGRDDRLGEANCNAKLSDGEVASILRDGAAGVTPAALAIEFNVSRPMISRILSGKSWKHMLG